ncbi:MAG: hypothetical protein JSV35_05835 [Candidatus Bathyarchaeota archaeon]|nr:MAG: hypothetical protein JSV35_05835 [Candidatus Bathyarchaeota archaeon]
MPARKITVEVLDEVGNRYSITFEGEVTRDKALNILDIVELLGGVTNNRKLESHMRMQSKYSKTKHVVEKCFPFNWFSSKDLLDEYENRFNEKISLSTISTYLARMVSRGFAVSNGSAHNRKYRMATELMKSMSVKTKNVRSSG